MNVRTAAEIAAGVVPTNPSFLPLTAERYGAVGNGTTDDTAALNKWVAVVNASTNPVSNWTSGSTYLTGPLNTFTVNNHTWNANGCTLLVKPNSGVGNLITGGSIGAGNAQNHVIRGLTINGNQGAFSSATTHNIEWFGNNPTFEYVNSINSSGYGLILDTVVGGRVAFCHLDSNSSGMGLLLQNVSYMSFVSSTANFNGYGFHKTLASNAFFNFGVGLRFRSHHNTFIDFHAGQNGRDGICCNQGSYANKFIGCSCWMNGDGGFTGASDNTGHGRPGEAESCYDNEYIDCESYNNWSAGLVYYTPAFNITVQGGRYYNNGRLAGSLASTVAFNTGIYFNTGSLGININAKCYDDRQVCPITANASGTLTATNWGTTSNGETQPIVPPLAQANFTPTAANYPKVAFYNASLVFQGYGMITSEAAGTVTVATLPNDGVTVASIASGWFISQRVQHNGCYFDVGCTAVANIDGFGHLTGPAGSAYGFKLVAVDANNTNVINTGDSLPALELLANPSWDAGVGAGTTWNYAIASGGSGPTAFTTAGPNLHSPGALQMAGGTSAASIGNSVLITGGSNHAQDCWVEASCLVTAINAGDANISITSSTSSSAVTHPGGGTKQLKIGKYLFAGNTVLILQVLAAPGKTVIFDEASVKVRHQPYDTRDFSYPTKTL